MASRKKRSSSRLTFNVEDLRTPDRLERVLRQIEGLAREQPQPDIDLGALANALEPSVQSQVQSLITINNPEGAGLFIVDTHFAKQNLKPPIAYDEGTAFYETDREVVFVNEIVNAAHVWRYFGGEYNDTIDNIPSDLGTEDANYRFLDTATGVKYRWDGDEWLSQYEGAAFWGNSDGPAFNFIRGLGSVLLPESIPGDAEMGRIDWNGQLSTTDADIAVGARLIAYSGSGWLAGGSLDWGSGPLGGEGVDSSWTGADYDGVFDAAKIGDDIYAATGAQTTSGLAEVWRLRSGTWSQIGGDSLNGSWANGATRTRVGCLATDGTRLYAGLGQFLGLSGGTQGEIWQLTPDATWVDITRTWVSGEAIDVNRLLYHGGVLYGAFVGVLAGFLETYDGTPGNWTQVANANGAAGIPSGLRGFYCLEVNAAGTHMYLGTGDQSGDAHVYTAEIGTWAWTAIADGAGSNGSWTNHEVVNDLKRDPNGDDIYALVLDTAAPRQRVYKWNGASWTKWGGDGGNGSWNSDLRGNTITFINGGLAVDAAYIYAGISADADDTGVWRRPHDASTDWEQIAGSTASLNNSWDTSTATGNPRNVLQVRNLGGTGLYAGLGDVVNSGDRAELWSTGLGANRSTYVELYVTAEDETSLTLTQKWFSSLDIFLGSHAGANDGIYWDESEASVGILTTTPARTLDVQGDDGIRINPASLPGTPGAGDLEFDADENDRLKYYSAGAWRRPTIGPSSVAAIGNIATWADIDGYELQDGGSPAAIVKAAGAWVPVANGDPDNPRIFFDSNGEVLMAWVPF